MLSIGLDALGDDDDDDDDDLIVYSEEKYEIDRNYRALLPLLQAESDREYVCLLDRCLVIRLLAPNTPLTPHYCSLGSYVRRMRIANSEEARLTQHIEGWRVGQQAFKTRWAPPLFQP